MFFPMTAYFIAETEVADTTEVADRKLSLRKALGGERVKTDVAPPARATSIQEKPPAVSRRGSILKPFSSLRDEPDQKLR